jgi:hypothetical protein
MAANDLSIRPTTSSPANGHAESAISLDQIIGAVAETQGSLSCRPGELIIGMLSDVDSAGVPTIALEEDTSGREFPALAVVDVSRDDVGRRVVVAFSNGQNSQPIILGFLRSASAASPDAAETCQVVADEETKRIEARKRLELRCGKASIVLTAEGDILIRGEYVVSRASGTNRIRGGNVQIN